MAVDLQAVAQLLQASLNPSQRQQAEQTLQQKEAVPEFSLGLLQIVDQDSFDVNTRLAAALYFKNFIRRNWVDEDGNHKRPAEEVNTIKTVLIGLMIRVPPNIQAQLGEAVSVIADSDFWERWDTLVDDLVSRLTPDNFSTNNGVLEVAHSIFKRWRPLFRSDALFTEINHVLQKFDKPFLSLLQSTDAAITASQGNKDALKGYFATLTLLFQIMYDLASQDLPPIMEENPAAFTELLHKYLTYDNAILRTDDEDEPGPLEHSKAAVFEVLVLLVQKYGEVFGPFLQPFVESSWTLLTTVSTQTKYDLLVSRALEFLTVIAGDSQQAQPFNNQQVLSQVVENVVVPNVTLRESDIEMFEDEPVEFIRRDLEGADTETRRRSAIDFLRRLMEQFEQLVTQVTSNYIETYLTQYASNPQENWRSKDTAIYLFTSIAAKGRATAAHGVTTLNSNVNIQDFFQKNIAGDLQSDTAHPLLKVDAIKYLYTFRSLIGKDFWQAAFPVLVQHLGSSNYVVYTYASIATERVLYLTGENREPIIPKDSVLPLSKELLRHLFSLITKNTDPAKLQENEFLMRCIMRVLIVIREDVSQVMDDALTNLVNITMVIRHNPSNPRFYYYHFESIGALIRYGSPQPQLAAKLEERLWGPFSAILSDDVQEFAPYVFQLCSALLESNASSDLPGNYAQLLPACLSPVLWDSKGNTPALTRLLSSMIPRAKDHIAQNNQIEPILGIFQKLIASKRNDIYGFDLLETLLATYPPQQLQSYWHPLLSLMFKRLSDSKTESFTMRFVRFYHFVSARSDKGLGADYFINMAEQVQANVFTPIYLQIILPDTQKFSRPIERKLAVVSLTKTVADSGAFVEKYGRKGWGLTTEALLALLVNPPVISQDQDYIIPDQDVDDVGFGVGFTALNTCKRPPTDPYPEITDVKQWVGKYLLDADSRHNGRISRFVGERLSDQAKGVLQALMQG